MCRLRLFLTKSHLIFLKNYGIIYIENRKRDKISEVENPQ